MTLRPTPLINGCGSYFPEKQRDLFRQEPQACFFVLSECPPTTQHNLFSVETKPFTPQIEVGQAFDFQLRANPVITRQKTL